MLYGPTISVIDVPTNANFATINLKFKSGYANCNATASELWGTDATNAKVVYYIDMGANTLMKHGEFTAGADAHVTVFNGNYGYVINQGATTVSVINITTPAKVKNVSVKKKPQYGNYNLSITNKSLRIKTTRFVQLQFYK